MQVISANNLVVEFPIYTSGHRSLKKAVLHASTGGRIAQDARARVTVRALDGISFVINSGDRVGLVGHNGSGKTTLLRVLAGAYEPVSGKLEMYGRVASLLDIAMGMDNEATGYENIILRGIMMGLPPAEMRARMEEIAEFSELGEYLNMPVRTYSAGMQMRLAFAVSTSISADILLMDEWLSIGDAQFSEKASKRLEAIIAQSQALVIASHSPELISKLCNRGIRLHQGRLEEEFVP
jgi:lipopolysaccharide transport system ATP-binding protein